MLAQPRLFHASVGLKIARVRSGGNLKHIEDNQMCIQISKSQRGRCTLALASQWEAFQALRVEMPSFWVNGGVRAWKGQAWRSSLRTPIPCRVVPQTRPVACKGPCERESLAPTDGHQTLTLLLVTSFLSSPSSFLSPRLVNTYISHSVHID